MNPKIAEIVAYIDNIRAQIFKSIDALPQPAMDHKMTPDEWSISEVLSHLHAVEKGMPKLFIKLWQQAEANGLQPETSGSWLHSLDAFKLEVVQQKMAAPERVLPQSGLTKEELVQQLQASRQAVKDAVAQASNHELSGVVWPHPFLGDLNFYQWLLFIGKHEQRHLHQIQRLKLALLA